MIDLKKKKKKKYHHNIIYSNWNEPMLDGCIGMHINNEHQ